MTDPWPIKKACSTEFKPAYHNSGTRPLTDVYWIVMHDEEAPTAEGAAQYFQSAASGGSAHLCVDKDECYRCLDNDVIPWGAASAPTLSANRHGFHIEQAGYASWTEEKWPVDELKRAAYKTAIHLKLFKCPPRFVTAAQLIIFGNGGTRRKGVTTHAEVSAASKILDPSNWNRYTHTDPGEGWPREEFMRLVTAYFNALK